jgi:hypothetical protein
MRINKHEIHFIKKLLITSITKIITAATITHVLAEFNKSTILL